MASAAVDGIVMTTGASFLQKAWGILKKAVLRFRLWRLERKIDFHRWDRGLSLKIDSIRNCLEKGGRT